MSDSTAKWLVWSGDSATMVTPNRPSEDGARLPGDTVVVTPLARSADAPRSLPEVWREELAPTGSGGASCKAHIERIESPKAGGGVRPRAGEFEKATRVSDQGQRTLRLPITSRGTQQ
jgi:hypothetical protein